MAGQILSILMAQGAVYCSWSNVPALEVAMDHLPSSTAKGPALPTTPGEWLRCFRQRLRGDDEEATSLQALSRALGVSEKTIRRWETGHAQPTQRDLQHFASYFRLSALQQNFLNRAFSNMRYGAAPTDQRLLEGPAKSLLAVELPVYLLDRLFYVRAWNSYAAAVEMEAETPEACPHFIARTLRLRHFREGAHNYHLFLRQLLETMWIGTGRICGSPGYMQMLRELDQISGFRESWSALAAESRGQDVSPGGSQDFTVSRVGTFRLVASKIEFPPTYYLIQYVPVDDLAWANLTALRQGSAPQSVLASAAS